MCKCGATVPVVVEKVVGQVTGLLHALSDQTWALRGRLALPPPGCRE